MTNGAAQNLGILYPDTENRGLDDVPLSPKIPLDDVFEDPEETTENVATDGGIL